MLVKFDASRPRKKGLGGGRGSLICDPGSELRLGKRGNIRAKKINGMQTKKKEEERTHPTPEICARSSCSLCGFHSAAWATVDHTDQKPICPEGSADHAVRNYYLYDV